MFWSKAKREQIREQEPEQEQDLTTWAEAEQNFTAGYLAVLQQMDQAAAQYFGTRTQEARERERHDSAMFQLIQAGAEIESCKERIGDLYALLDLAEMELAQAMVGGKNQVKQQKAVIALKKQIDTAEAKLRKAQFCKYTAEQRLYA